MFGWFDLLLKGGPVMWPLFLCAIVSVWVMFDRYRKLKTVLRDNRGLIKEIQTSLKLEQYKSVEDYLKLKNGPVVRLLEAALANRNSGREELEHLVEEIAIEETPALSHNLNILDTIITIAPLLGLLGTVTGMIKSFNVVSLAAGGNAPAQITGGVAEALIATATGLAIAIVTLVGYNYLTEQVKAIVSDMEIGATKIINILELNRVKRSSDNETARV